MRNTETRALKLPTVLVGLCLASVAPLSAQQPSAGIPRSADGHPDLSGTWDNGAGIDFVRPTKEGDSVCIFGCAGGAAPPPAAGPAPRQSTPQYRPEFAARVADLDKRQVQEDPVLRCVAPGVPRIGPPDKIVQRAGEAVFLYEDVSGSFFRIVPTDGRPHPTNNEPSFLGDAVGHWEGDTLVVETKNFNDQTWLTDNGAFHTTDLARRRALEPHGRHARVERDGARCGRADGAMGASEARRDERRTSRSSNRRRASIARSSTWSTIRITRIRAER